MKHSIVSVVISSALFCAGCERVAFLTQNASDGDVNNDIVQTTNRIDTPFEFTFTPDGASYTLKPGEKQIIYMELPEGIETPSALWFPVEGAMEPTLAIQRSYRTLEQGVYFSEHHFEAREVGQSILTFAVRDMGEIVHPERRVVTFNVVE